MVVAHPSRTSKELFAGGRAARWPRILLCLFAAVLALRCGSVQAEPPVSKEYQIKAAFLFNFIQFVEWPASAFTNAQAPFRIGILGNDPFGGALDQTVQGETIQNHKLKVERSQRLEGLQGCQLIFISKSEKRHVDEILPKLQAGKILTVSEIPGFASHGGMINFYVEGNKVRFEINPATAQSEGLKISSQLLGLGKIVKPDPEKHEK
jgi:hypothetical protein